MVTKKYNKPGESVKLQRNLTRVNQKYKKYLPVENVCSWIYLSTDGINVPVPGDIFYGPWENPWSRNGLHTPRTHKTVRTHAAQGHSILYLETETKWERVTLQRDTQNVSKGYTERSLGEALVFNALCNNSTNNTVQTHAAQGRSILYLETETKWESVTQRDIIKSYTERYYKELHRSLREALVS